MATVICSGISDELSRNAALNGYALYRVDTNLDGTVSLEGYDSLNNKAIIGYNSDVKVTTNASALLTKDSAGKYETQLIAVNDNTQYLVKTSDGYDTYTGTANVPNFVAGADVFYCDVNGDEIADYVYIKDGTLESTTGNHVVYVAGAEYTKATEDDEYVMTNVILDGASATLTVNDLGIAQTLSAGEGKTFVATFASGVVTKVELADATAASVAEPSESSLVVYLGDDVTVSGTTMIGEYAKTSYRINSAAVCGEDVALTTNDLEGYGVWVVYTPDTYNTVSHVYVGKALNETAAANIYVNKVEAANKINFDNGDYDASTQTWSKTITGPAADSANLTALAWDNATLSTWENQTGTYGSATVGKISVTSEAGNNTVNYAITREAEEVTTLENAVKYIRNGNDNAVLAQDVNVYFDIETAAANAITLQNDNKYVNAVLYTDTELLSNYATGYGFKVVRFTDGASAVNQNAFDAAAGTTVSLTAGKSDNIKIDDLKANTVVVVKLLTAADENGQRTPVYFAFKVVNP